MVVQAAALQLRLRHWAPHAFTVPVSAPSASDGPDAATDQAGDTWASLVQARPHKEHLFLRFRMAFLKHDWHADTKGTGRDPPTGTVTRHH